MKPGLYWARVIEADRYRCQPGWAVIVRVEGAEPFQSIDVVIVFGNANAAHWSLDQLLSRIEIGPPIEPPNNGSNAGNPVGSEHYILSPADVDRREQHLNGLVEKYLDDVALPTKRSEWAKKLRSIASEGFSFGLKESRRAKAS